jgi:acetyl esterase/lipase
MLRIQSLMLRALVATMAGRARRGPLRASWPFRFEVIFRFLKLDWTTLWRKPPTEIRAYLDAVARLTPASWAADRRPERAAGLPAEWFSPKGGPRGEGVVLYFPGGSYIFGSTATHRDAIASLAVATGLRVLAVDYRRAPEHPYPAAPDDALAAYRWLLAEGVDPRRIVLAGESAGGNLALVTLIELSRRGEPLPAGALIISPWLDMESSGASMETNAPCDWGSREMLLFQARQYAGGADLRDPRLSPLHAELRGLPPVFLQVGECEILLDQCKAFAARALAAGVELTLNVVPEMPHAPYFFAAHAPAAARALEALAAFARDAVVRFASD